MLAQCSATNCVPALDPGFGLGSLIDSTSCGYQHTGKEE